jgi:hypothetical protein
MKEGTVSSNESSRKSSNEYMHERDKRGIFYWDSIYYLIEDIFSLKTLIV